MKNSSRRVLMFQVAAGSALLSAVAAQAQTLPMVNEKDAQPMALGYVADTNKADGKKFPKHAATQKAMKAASANAGGIATGARSW